ncbi:hypothetical protein DFH08DRAFT_1046089 [Mycena albidolilacea]|uniref:DUF659 domain-containing protein n=1 Tax=Mycena albidolilacea TaxID=1033008 RepID=A0AAD6Z853_9AGAR|nr:hypothetical protein DFH08DRAFT_1046089 [Mycena albidolilacea]
MGIAGRTLSETDPTESTDGWRSNAKDAVGCVSLSHKFKCLLIDIIRTNAWKKDGESMRLRFGNMIDEAEKKWACNVLGLLTDNDGGSKKGRKVLGDVSPWLLLFPCCGHQGQLILAKYLRENPKAAQIFEELIDCVNWINSKDKVRDIFDKTQLEMDKYGKILAYILPNLTRWTTHLVAALRFAILKAPIRNAILNKRAESSRRKRDEMREDAMAQCATLEPNAWWDDLEKIIPDLEHICYLTNIAQSDQVRPDQFLLALTGLFLHFRTHVCAHRKRFKELDQSVFILALVLNPFQKLSRFGDKANIDQFVLSTEIVTERINSRPPSTPRTPEAQQQHDARQKLAIRSLSVALMQYLSGTGPFANWEKPHIQETYCKLHGNNPIPYWEAFRTNGQVAELAKFALRLLYLVMNQAGLECWFSDFSNKKNKKCNRLGLTKMGQQSKVMRNLREKQFAEGLAEKREGRENHSEAQTKLLLAVPRYAAALLSDTDDSDGEATEQVSVILKSKAAWRRQLAKWEQELRDAEAEAPNWEASAPPSGCESVTEESLYMELLAAEYSDEEPDAGAQEGSGDDFEA